MTMAEETIDPLRELLTKYQTGTLLLLESLGTSGHFLMPWLAAACMRQGHKVVFVAAAHSPSKHQSALKKLGINTNSLQQQQQQQHGSVAFVSLANALRQETACQEQHSCLQELFRHVHAAATELLGNAPQQQAVTVIVDSLACISAAAGTASASVEAWLHYLVALGEHLKVPYRLLLLAAHDIQQQQAMLQSLSTHAHVVASLHHLDGKTAALDGSMRVTIRKAAPSLQRQTLSSGVQPGGLHPKWLTAGSSSVWFFRCGDLGIKWFSELHGKELMA